MKKIAILLFLSVFVSIIHAATMPIGLDLPSVAVSAPSNHEHCHEANAADTQEHGSKQTNWGSGHSCCSVLAVLISTPMFDSPIQPADYLASQFFAPISNVAESIYKPPKIDL